MTLSCQYQKKCDQRVKHWILRWSPWKQKFMALLIPIEEPKRKEGRGRAHDIHMTMMY